MIRYILLATTDENILKHATDRNIFLTSDGDTLLEIYCSDGDSKSWINFPALESSFFATENGVNLCNLCLFT